MSNYNQQIIRETLTRSTDPVTGEILSEDFTKESNQSYYLGPRKYWRIMELYDKAQLLLGSKPGIKFIIYLKSEINTTTYRIDINKTWLAEDLNISRRTVINIINTLLANGYIIKEDRSQYFINPELFYSQDIDSREWQDLKQDFQIKLLKLKIANPKDEK